MPVSYTHLDVYKRQVMKKASPETMRDVKMRAFGKHLALMGVKKLHTRYGDQYLLNRL